MTAVPGYGHFVYRMVSSYTQPVLLRCDTRDRSEKTVEIGWIGEIELICDLCNAVIRGPEVLFDDRYLFLVYQLLCRNSQVLFTETVQLCGTYRQQLQVIHHTVMCFIIVFHH